MGYDAYTAGEVVWLLGLTREEVVLEDLPGSVLGQLDGGGESDGHRIPTLARWAEVHRARDRVIRRRAIVEAASREFEALRLVARGYTQQEAAAIAKTSQPTVSRRARAALREVLAELGGELVEDRGDLRSLCLSCGTRPRARVPAVKRARPGMEALVVRPERPIGLCTECATAVTVFSVAPRSGVGRPAEVLDYIAWVEVCVRTHGLRLSDERVASVSEQLLATEPAAARGQAATMNREAA